MRLDVAGQRPQFTAEEARALARKLYGLTAVAARALPSDRDQNFYLETAAAAYVLKIAGSAEAAAVLDFQNQALLHLGRRPAVASYVPQLLPAVSGGWQTAVAGREGQTHWVRLLGHLPGTPLGAIQPHAPALLAECGRLLGRLDAALLNFSHPAMGRRLHWDLAHAQETLDHYAPTIADPARRKLVQRFTAQFADEVVPHLPALRRSVIHSDGNDHNILVADDGVEARHVTGLIDFGDMVYSATVFEPAIAAAYLMLDKADPGAAAAAVVAGYDSALPLRAQEVALLPALIAIRLCLSVSLSAYQRAREPGNDYLSISERPAWALLGRLAEMPPGELGQRLQAARLHTAEGETNDDYRFE